MMISASCQEHTKRVGEGDVAKDVGSKLSGLIWKRARERGKRRGQGKENKMLDHGQRTEIVWVGGCWGVCVGGEGFVFSGVVV